MCKKERKEKKEKKENKKKKRKKPSVNLFKLHMYVRQEKKTIQNNNTIKHAILMFLLLILTSINRPCTSTLKE